MTTPSKIKKSDIDKTFVDSLATVEYVNDKKSFGRITVGNTTIITDTISDTLTISSGSNISLTPDATNDKITISATDTTYSAAGNSLGLVKSGGDVTISNGIITVNDDSHIHTIDDVDGLRTALNNKSRTTHTHGYDSTLSLDSTNAVQSKTFTTEINAINSSITSLNNNKANSSHTHSTDNITSGTLTLARGGTGITSNPSMLVNLASTTADTVFEASPRPGVTGVLPVANGGTGGTNAAYILNMMGQGTYTVGVNEALDKTSWFEVARCPITSAGLTQRTTLLVSGSWGYGTCILHIAMTIDGNGSILLSSCEMEMVAKTSQMTSGVFAVDASSEPGVAILYVKITEHSWYNFKILHQQIYANYSTEYGGHDITQLNQRWTFKVNYGAPASAVRKDSITRTLYC